MIIFLAKLHLFDIIAKIWIIIKPKGPRPTRDLPKSLNGAPKIDAKLLNDETEKEN